MLRALALLIGASATSATTCDIFAAGKTPCVAAHSTTRALFKAVSFELPRTCTRAPPARSAHPLLCPRATLWHLLHCFVSGHSRLTLR
jgi:hypothetical protein